MRFTSASRRKIADITEISISTGTNRLEKYHREIIKIIRCPGTSSYFTREKEKRGKGKTINQVSLIEVFSALRLPLCVALGP